MKVSLPNFLVNQNNRLERPTTSSYTTSGRLLVSMNFQIRTLSHQKNWLQDTTSLVVLMVVEHRLRGRVLPVSLQTRKRKPNGQNHAFQKHPRVLLEVATNPTRPPARYYMRVNLEHIHKRPDIAQS